MQTNNINCKTLQLLQYIQVLQFLQLLYILKNNQKNIAKKTLNEAKTAKQMGVKIMLCPL
jgi:hypothetical protein